MDRRVLATTLVLAASCASPASPAIVPPSPPDSTPTSTAPPAINPEPESSGFGTTSPSSTVPGVAPVGFATTLARVTESDGEQCEICVWVATDAEQRAGGLMGVTELEPAAGMAFVYPSPHTGTFWMKNTVMPLSIAFFAPDGAYLDAFDMEPCTDDPCPNYQTPADFLIALEVPQGRLGAVGIGDGSRFELLDLPCDVGA